MPNFRERTRIRRAAIAAGSQLARPPAPEPRPRPVVPTFTGWPIDIPAPPAVDEAGQMIVEAEVVEELVDQTMSEEEQAVSLEEQAAMVETTSAEVTVAELEAMSYRELQIFLKKNDLSATGTKAEMLARATEFAEGELIG